MHKVIIQSESIDVVELLQGFHLLAEKHHCGAVLSFCGVARADKVLGEQVQEIVLEHYPGMTEKALEQVVVKAFEQWPIKVCTVVHRVGGVSVGETIVLVMIASSHRKPSINALDFIMDFLKSEVPLWKKERTLSDSHWTEQKNSDKQAKKRW